MRTLPLLLCLAAPVTARAQAPPILQALRAHDWTQADALAAADPDPLAAKLVTLIRLVNAGQTGAAEIDAFMRDNPTWPDQDRLARRYDEALTDEPDESRLASQCTTRLPSAGAALLRCAEAWALAGDTAGATGAARRGWVALQTTVEREADALARWGGVLTQADQEQRFQTIEPADQDAAQRQLARLPPADRAVGQARLAFRRRDQTALSILEAVPEGSRHDPALLLDEARYLRRSNADQPALALWRGTLSAVETAAPADRRAAFWAERDALARHLLASGDDAGAYSLANDEDLPADQALDAQFLAGWIALRRLHEPARARQHFTALAEAAHAAITKARAYYWLARAQTDANAALATRALAASLPTTYYGQLAAREAGQPDDVILTRIAALRDPPGMQAALEELEGTELAHAAVVLVSWQDPRRAADFLHQLSMLYTTAADRAAVARIALRLGVPDMAVQAARLAGRDGAALAQSGWPMPVHPQPGPVSSSLVLAIMRQESSFDPGAVSPAGAHGLMQLMPGTASQVARAQHVQPGPLSDPAINMRLGTAYLGTLLAQFGGSQPYAIAAYNAGPRRVHEWVAANGDAAAGDADAMVDWIELIPFAETRNYVQRVLENMLVYRAKAQGAG